MKNAILERLKRYPLAVICAVVLIGFAAVIFMRGGVVDNLSVEEAELTSRIRLIDENIKNSKNLAEQLEALEALVASAESRLFVRDERAINTNFFYSFEDRVDVRITEVSQLASEDPSLAKGGPRELKLHNGIVYNISVTGGFEAILEFLHELHAVEPFVRVADFQINDDGRRGSQADSLNAKLRVVVLAKKS